MRNVVVHLFTILRLMILDHRALIYLNTEKDFVRRSLYLPLLLSAGQILLYANISPGGEKTLNLSNSLWILYYLFFTIGWISFLLLVKKISQMIDKEKLFRTYVVAFCWATPFQFIVLTGLFLTQVFISQNLLNAFFFSMSMIFVYVLNWSVAKTTLRLSRLSSFGLVLLFDLLTNFFPTLMIQSHLSLLNSGTIP